MADWSPERSASLRKMWLDGCSAGIIGSRLGVTRDAVLGRARRMGLDRSSTATTVALPTHPERAEQLKRVTLPLPRENPVWTVEDDDKRRMVFARRASMGARRTLEAAGL